jgi:hypothetical protein
MTQTIAYLERRYAILENEIENALQDGRTDHPAIADPIYRKLIVAEEVKYNRRLVELRRVRLRCDRWPWARGGILGDRMAANTSTLVRRIVWLLQLP